MASKKPLGEWIEDQLEKDPKLRREVDLNLEKLRVKKLKEIIQPIKKPLTRN